MSRKLVAGLVLGLLIMVGLISLRAYLRSYQQVTIDIDARQNVSLYKGAYEGDGHTAVNLADKLREISDNQPFKMKRGRYTAVLDDPQKQFATTAFALDVGETPVTLKVRPSFSANKLSTLLAGEEPTIRKILQDKYPQIGRDFTVVSGSLYVRGDWYAALLKPSDPSRDTYRVVLQKRGGKWRIVTNPPEIIISKVKFPDIPTEVLSDVDNFKR